MKSTIDIQSLEFSYDHEPILQIADLKIENHDKVFLHGKSGSGKTTLLSLIAGILKPTKGSISILGQNLEEIALSKKDQFRGQNIGFIFQSFNLIPYLNVLDNILLPATISKKEAEYSERAKDLANKLHLNANLKQAASNLSVGQQQRVAAARALLLKPQLIVADEPTSALDQENTDEFLKLLMNHWEEEKFTLLFVSHDKSLEKHFHRSLDLAKINKVTHV